MVRCNIGQSHNTFQLDIFCFTRRIWTHRLSGILCHRWWCHRHVWWLVTVLGEAYLLFWFLQLVQLLTDCLLCFVNSTGLTHQSFLKILQSQGDLCSKTQHLQQRRSKVAAQSCRNFGLLPRLPQDASIITRMAQQLHCNDTVPSSFLWVERMVEKKNPSLLWQG